MFQKLLCFRYMMVIIVIMMLVSSLLPDRGYGHVVKGYLYYIQAGFVPGDEFRAGFSVMNGLDAFMLAIIFMIFGLGTARLFLF
ncbi:MAG: hypothetical protein U5L72_12390 [Bacteroidales bacterium]|nr:hypothetical protein [Bacteroidales bacterium]